ncbi:BQ5605_C016g08235 [Microbotryum silenes-dioicae]|uniref:BQ5605_C016g08235 protein n=1 Tax=Microbotryum silenes-dioicae TaxID=796604 RepID=A0A2X0LVK8_9BASI|nr:BQ5605_C016g08235 [Microbotryum silenes-dioicae]
MSYYLVLVGTLDNPLYETYLTSTKSASSTILSVPVVSSGAPATSFSIFGSLPPNPNSNSTSTSNPNKPPPPPPSLPTGTQPTPSQNNNTFVGYGHKSGPQGRHVMQLVAHASLDVVEDVQWTNGAMYVGIIPLFCESSFLAVLILPGHQVPQIDRQVSRMDNLRLDHTGSTESFLTVPIGVKLILLHEVKNDDGIRLFFQETWENYVKTLLNPFHELNSPINSPVFDARVKASAKKHL